MPFVIPFVAALFAWEGMLNPQTGWINGFLSLFGITGIDWISSPDWIYPALVLIGLPGLLREFEEYRPLIYGGAIMAIMILRPQGLIPNVRRSRELHEEEVEQDAWARGTTDDREAVAAVLPGGGLGVEREDLE